jgi:D-beta-D-heptose 7-phosphate kinase/D-beta-D-heptose 1-phosphate adenosyltransferase
MATAAADTADVIVVSDYAKGVVPSLVSRELIAVARRRGVPIVVDSKALDLHRFAGATVLTPEATTFAAAAGVDGSTAANTASASRPRPCHASA